MSRIGRRVGRLGGLFAAVIAIARIAGAQTAPCPEPVKQPPADSPVLVNCVSIVAHPVNETIVASETYASYITMPLTRPSQDTWARYDEQVVLADFSHLWNTGFLDNLWVEVIEEPFTNGVAARHVVFHIEERDRVKSIDYVSAEGRGLRVPISRIDSSLKEQQINLGLDAFLDEAQVRKVIGILRQLYTEQGFNEAVIDAAKTPVPGLTKLVNLRFTVREGPRLRIRDIVFDGNNAFSDATLRRQLKRNKRLSRLFFFLGGGAYRDELFAEDAERLMDFYKNHGYAAAQVGLPQLETIHVEPSGSTRWIRLRVPVDEGLRYAIGNFEIANAQALRAAALRTLFDVHPGDVYSLDKLRKGIERAKEVYGAYGYYQWTPSPELQPRGIDPATGQATAPDGPVPVMDVTVRMNEGKAFRVRRISFVGNTRTHDSVIRRELRLVEGGLFNSEALKASLRRINQLGYFKPLEANQVDVTPTSGTDDNVDLTVRVEEQGRNQTSFGAGVSETTGLYGQLLFQTSNFLGRGQTLSVSAQRGSQANNQQIAITEPYLFDRPLTAGATLYSRKTDYRLTDGTLGYSEARNGFGLTTGWATRGFTRLFGQYTYEVIDTAVRDDLKNTTMAGGTGTLAFNTTIDEGRHIESRIEPTIVFDTVDHPFMPRHGVRLTGTYEVSGGILGGNVNFIRPTAEAIVYIAHTRRTALGLRAQAGWVRQYGRTLELPYYSRYFLGGETQIRGVDIRTVGPLDDNDRALGGNKFALFNAEYYLDIGPVRTLAFHDAGQAFGAGTSMSLRNLRTSTGAEARFIVPMLNVPVRLIYAFNFYRDTFQPKRTFKFSVGTTF